MSNKEKQRHRIVIVGGGIAGLEIASTLGRKWRLKEDAPLINLIDCDSAHVWKPMLHTIAAGTSDISQQQTTYVAHAHEMGFIYTPGELIGLDRRDKALLLSPIYAPDGRQLVPAQRRCYDTLILAIGSRANNFGTPGVSEHCFVIDSRRQAEVFNQEIRLRLLQSIEEGTPLSIGIVGGGATGVELAAELMRLIELSMAYGAQNLASCITITLIESGPRLLAAFPQDISEAALERLTAIGIKVHLNARVNSANQQGFVLNDGSNVTALLKIWAAGVRAPEVLANLDGLESNRTNQLLIFSSLQTTEDKSIYAVGDCSSHLHFPFPPTAQVAHQQAKHLIRYLPYALRNAAPVPDFVYKNRGSLVSLSEYGAYGSLGQVGLLRELRIRGRLAKFSHVLLYRSHQTRLHGLWRGSLLWLVDLINARLRASIRLD